MLNILNITAPASHLSAQYRGRSVKGLTVNVAVSLLSDNPYAEFISNPILNELKKIYNLYSKNDVALGDP